MTDEQTSVRDAYDTVAADYARLLPGLAAESAVDVAVLDDFVGRVRGGGPVLDVGCGPGRLTRYLHDHGVDVAGLDLSPGMVRVARDRHPDLSFVHGSLDALAVPSGSLTGVLAWYSVIHTSDGRLEAVLAELVRVLAPGGWLLVGCQSGAGSRHITGAYGHDLDLTAHLHTADRIADVITAAGTEVHLQLTRAPEGSEKHAQARVLARRADDPPASGPL